MNKEIKELLKFSQRKQADGELAFIYKCERTGTWWVKRTYDKKAWEIHVGSHSIMPNIEKTFETAAIAKRQLSEVYHKFIAASDAFAEQIASIVRCYNE
jgi:hypothetical protein